MRDDDTVINLARHHRQACVFLKQRPKRSSVFADSSHLPMGKVEIAAKLAAALWPSLASAGDRADAAQSVDKFSEAGSDTQLAKEVSTGGTLRCWYHLST